MPEQNLFSLNKIIKIGTRQSELAIKQTNLVIDHLKNFYKNLEFKIVQIKTTGDLIKDKALYDCGGKALFTKEIDQSLSNGEIDLAVHSAKDIDSKPDSQICFPLILPREDPSDCLISFKYKSLNEIPLQGKIGTCSLRRKEQTLLLRPDLNFEIMRGNIDSRIKKLQNSSTLDGIILASAGLKRINLEKYITQKFLFDEIIPSPCQGLIAVSCLKSNLDLTKALSSTTDHKSDLNFRIERKFIETLSASCKSAVGCFSQFIDQNKIKIMCIVLNQEKKIYKKIVFICQTNDCLIKIEKIAKDLSEYLD
jgi:hydroxymethylbilane synthase